jgi:hypothetical protein
MLYVSPIAAILSCVALVVSRVLSPAVALKAGALLPTRGAAAFTTTALRLEARTTWRAATRAGAAVCLVARATLMLRDAQRAIVTGDAIDQ